MPCWEVRTTSLEAPAANVDVMAKALSNLGLTVTSVVGRAVNVENEWGSGFWADGRLTFNGEGSLSFDQNALRREYSKESIKHTAKARGWKVRFQKSGKIEAVRRRYV